MCLRLASRRDVCLRLVRRRGAWLAHLVGAAAWVLHRLRHGHRARLRVIPAGNQLLLHLWMAGGHGQEIDFLLS